MPRLAARRGADRLSPPPGAGLLSAALIVRDEQAQLGACLASIADVVDEIVVVDTGSVDGTVAVARSYGARVFEIPWRHDFSDARNQALAHVTGRWVLAIDADERLRPVARAEVVDLLDGAAEVAFRVLLYPFAHSTPYLEYRLWRSDAGVRFQGVVNERMVDSLAAVAGPVGVCGLALDHLGYDGDQTAKLGRNLALLEARLLVEDDNVFDWRQLARALRALGRDEEAEQALVRAVDVSRLHPGATEDSLAWIDLIEARRDRGGDVALLVAEGRRRWPDNWQLRWVEAQAHLAEGRYRDAVVAFQQLLGVDRATLPAAGIAYDERIFGALAQAGLGACWFEMGRYDEAARAYGAAETSEPDSVEYRTKRIVCQRRAGKSGTKDGHRLD